MPTEISKSQLLYQVLPVGYLMENWTIGSFGELQGDAANIKKR